jgi:hypothetical protein
VSESAGEGETSLLRSTLSLTADAAGAGRCLGLAQLTRLSQARGHLRAGQVFIHEVHGDFRS